MSDVMYSVRFPNRQEAANSQRIVLIEPLPIISKSREGNCPTRPISAARAKCPIIAHRTAPGARGAGLTTQLQPARYAG